MLVKRKKGKERRSGRGEEKEMEENEKDRAQRR